MPRPARHRLVPLLAAAALVLALAVPAAASANVVLGGTAFAAPYGEGFGEAEPSEIFNGGDPSGSIHRVHWSGWGNPSALGWGLNPTFKPGGGYYRKPARIKLRATDLGRCAGRRAYTRLEIRAPKAPGGKLGPWRSWSGAKTICKPPY